VLGITAAELDEVIVLDREHDEWQLDAYYDTDLSPFYDIGHLPRIVFSEGEYI
jgi:hypothetical protein